MGLLIDCTSWALSRGVVVTGGVVEPGVLIGEVGTPLPGIKLLT